jgi:hypothetical protein
VIRRAVPAVLGAFSQAAGSLVIQLICARTLALSEFGTLGLVLGVLVLATALSTSMIGDTLTVLDRHDPQIRRALAVTALIVVIGGGLLAGLGCATSGLITAGEGWLLSALVAAWLAEDVVRRVLMACGRYWFVIVVDLTHLGVSCTVVLARPHLTGAPTTLALILAALICGQVTAGAVGVLCLPPSERAGWGRPGPGPACAWRRTVHFGLARAAQAGLRPAVLLVMRTVVVIAAGKAAYGALEAARLYVAPALLVVNGAGSYLLPRFAKGRSNRLPDSGGDEGLCPEGNLENGANRDDSLGGDRAAVVMADRSAVLLTASAVLGTIGAAGLAAVAPALLTGHADVNPWAVLSWGLYSTAVATALPYGTLAAAWGDPWATLLVRLADAATSCVVVTGSVLWGGLNPIWAPLTVAIGVVCGAACLRPMALTTRRRRSSPA